MSKSCRLLETSIIKHPYDSEIGKYGLQFNANYIIMVVLDHSRINVLNQTETLV